MTDQDGHQPPPAVNRTFIVERELAKCFQDGLYRYSFNEHEDQSFIDPYEELVLTLLGDD